MKMAPYSVPRVRAGTSAVAISSLPEAARQSERALCSRNRELLKLLFAAGGSRPFHNVDSGPADFVTGRSIRLSTRVARPSGRPHLRVVADKGSGRDPRDCYLSTPYSVSI